MATTSELIGNAQRIIVDELRDAKLREISAEAFARTHEASERCPECDYGRRQGRSCAWCGKV
jgi:hypothetical protein